MSVTDIQTLVELDSVLQSLTTLLKHELSCCWDGCAVLQKSNFCLPVGEGTSL